jgi:HK97 family phage prohead protease
MLPRRDQLQRRLADTNASSVGALTYNKNDHSVEAIISKGSPVKRNYGTEVLHISRDAVDLSRMQQGGIPLLDHHSQAGIDQVLGRVTDTWFDRGALVGRLQFSQTPQGKKAEGMVTRGEIAGISAGYAVNKWLVTNADGDPVDERDVGWDDDLTFTATRWQLFEVSLVGVPADAVAQVRAMPTRDPALADVVGRMRARQNIVLRNGRIHD